MVLAVRRTSGRSSALCPARIEAALGTFEATGRLRLFYQENPVADLAWTSATAGPRSCANRPASRRSP
jgi:hypothetical protein